MRYAIVCPGQGSQAAGMGKDLYENFAHAKHAFEEASDVLKTDMRALLFEPNENLGQSQWTQPAILLVSVIAAQIFEQESGQKPLFALGHSLGEISAVCLAGALSLANALTLVSERGKLMQTAQTAEPAGMMVVMGVSDSVLESFVQEQREAGKRVWVANYNTDGQVVLAGIKADLESLAAAKEALKAKRMLLLDISVASHCPLLEPIVAPFRELAAKALGQNFDFGVVSNVTTNKYDTIPQALELLGLQLVSPVRYKQCVQQHQDDVDVWVECGHGSVLRGLNSRLTSKQTMNVSDSATLKETLNRFKG
ncbi:MAG: ACP S-malonyltransferase [Helicobacter sp.]|nr:ACP S-malonyltransferase [Helicobacter sp.]